MFDEVKRVDMPKWTGANNKLFLTKWAAVDSVALDKLEAMLRAADLPWQHIAPGNIGDFILSHGEELRAFLTLYLDAKASALKEQREEAGDDL